MIAIAASLAVAASAHHASTVAVAQPWSRPAAAGTNGAGFMVLTNRGKTPDTLVKIDSPSADRVEMHESSMAGGVMSMRKIDSLPLAPGQSVTFAPGGYHVMLIRLKSALKAGDKVDATLTFASGAHVKVAFPVTLNPPAATPVSHDHH